jgi:capsular exopolysaccharide synthesis family protein
MQSATHFGEPRERRGDSIQQIRRYRRLLWRSKWYLLVSGAIVTCASLAVVAVFVNRQHEESTTAIIGVENTADLTAVKDVSGLMQAQSDLILSRTFLRDIVRKLSLQLALRKFGRASIFDSVTVDSEAIVGDYRFTIDKRNKDRFTMDFAKETKGGFSLMDLVTPRGGVQIYAGKTRIAELSVLDGQGMRLVFSPQFRAAPHDFRFKIRPMQNAVEDLFNAITVKESDSRSGVSNIAVSVKGRDYRLIAEVANAVADAFVQKNISFKGARTHSVVASLEKQMEAVSRDLSSSADNLRSFRAANPSVGLSENVKQRISGLSQLEKGELDVKKSLADAQDLEARSLSASEEDRYRIAQEILVFLAAKNVTSTAAYQSELGDLTAQSRDLIRNYSDDHPLRVENARKLEKLSNDIITLLKYYVSSTQSALAGKSSDIQSMNSELQGLPSKELQLADLERRYQIFSDIYSTVLSRYHQAKVLNTGEVAEVFVMDQAVPPISPPVNIPRLLGMAIAVSLALTVFPVLVAGYFDRTAHSEDDFVLKTGGLVLEGIPKIDVLRKASHNGHWRGVHGSDGSTLIALQNEEGVSKEVFRALRTKIMLRLFDVNEKSVVVTSLEPGAGKSTVAVNLAYALAEQHLKTIVVDGDMRRGTLYKWFGKEQGPGLSDFIASPDAVAPETVASIIQTTNLPTLSFISAGTPVQSSSELLASERFAQIKEELTRRFQLVIMDSPPIEVVIDAAVIAHLFSGFLVVARAGKTNVVELTRKIGEFRDIEERVLGFVLNGVSSERSAKYYRYSSYYAAVPPDKG